MSFLLDTHTLLYWFGSDTRLSPRQRRILRAADSEKPLWVSDISLWEIATLYQLGRIQLHRPLRQWLDAAVAPPLVRRIGISPAVAEGVAQLPQDFHRDPADRIIVASARLMKATLLTQDRRIINTGVVPTIS